jgi:hypothetical protein
MADSFEEGVVSLLASATGSVLDALSLGLFHWNDSRKIKILWHYLFGPTDRQTKPSVGGIKENSAVLAILPMRQFQSQTAHRPSSATEKRPAYRRTEFHSAATMRRGSAVAR